MNWRAAESAVAALEKALERGEPIGAYLACAAVLKALLEACYEEDGKDLPPAENLFAGLAETRLGRIFLPNLEAYARLCIRLDGVTPGRSPESYSQLTDARRLLGRMMKA